MYYVELFENELEGLKLKFFVFVVILICISIDEGVFIN